MGIRVHDELTVYPQLLGDAPGNILHFQVRASRATRQFSSWGFKERSGFLVVLEFSQGDFFTACEGQFRVFFFFFLGG